MDIYRVTLTDGQTFRMAADMTRAAAPISVDFHDEPEGSWQNTPIQTADAGHEIGRAAELVAEYFSAGPDDCAEVAAVTHIGGCDE